MKQIVTLFQPGSYGTFISWCIYSFSNLNTSNVLPVIDAQNSGHLYRQHRGNNLVIPSHCLIEDCSRYVFIDYRLDNAINYCNNQLDKQALGNLSEYLISIFPAVNDKLTTHWSSENQWALRELISFFINDMIISTKQQSDDLRLQIDKFTVVDIKAEDFLINPNYNLHKIYQKFNLSPNQWFDTMPGYVNTFINKQKYFNRHTELIKFVDATIIGTEFNLKFTTLIDEAYIQAELRNRGFELKCYNLNIFPLNSIELNLLLDR